MGGMCRACMNLQGGSRTYVQVRRTSLLPSKVAGIHSVATTICMDLCSPSRSRQRIYSSSIYPLNIHTHTHVEISSLPSHSHSSTTLFQAIPRHPICRVTHHITTCHHLIFSPLINPALPPPHRPPLNPPTRLIKNSSHP